MIRKLILSAILTAGTLAGLALTSATAEASPPWFSKHRQDRRHEFKVEYLHRGHWDTHGTYCDRDDAERAARQLRHRGYRVKIERC